MNITVLQTKIKGFSVGTLAQRARRLGSRLGSALPSSAGFASTSDAVSTRNWDWRAQPVSFEQTPDLAARMSRLRINVVQLLLDCDPAHRDDVLVRLRRARTAVDLWLLRIEAFRCIAAQHGEAMARQRIDSLLPHFDGWVPQRLLRPIPPPRI